MNSKKKILSLAALKKKLAFVKRRGKRIAFTNGCFDIVHAGHISYLEEAKKFNSVLVVGLNSDRSVRAIKGRSRPVNTQKARARVLAALACVDYVTIFNEETPLKLIEAIKPDILIKGADWKNKKIVGQDVIKRYDGKVELIRYDARYSTTKILKTIQKTCKK